MSVTTKYSNGRKSRSGAKKQVAGLLLADIVLNNLANRRSCCERKFSLPARPGSKTLLVCLGKPAVLRTAFRHSTSRRSQYGVPSCQAWQPYHEAQNVCSKLKFGMNWCEYWVHLIDGCYEIPPFLINISFVVQVVHKDITKVFHCRLPRYFYTFQGHLAQCCIIIRTVTNTQRFLGVKRDIELIGKDFTDINHWFQ